MAPIQKDGLVLVTGANGYLAGIAIQKLLDAGYRVRGTVRDPSKHSWMLSHYGPNFELVAVPDVSAPAAFDESIKQVDGIAHIAASIAFAPEVEETVVSEIKGMMNILEAAGKESSVKRVTYMSSQAACITPQSGEEYHIDTNTWNENTKQAWSLPESNDFPRCYMNYCCKKMEAEQRAFKWVEEHKPQFEFNSVVPNINWGTMVRPDMTGFISASAILKQLWDGNVSLAAMFPPSWCVDVEDTGLLTVATLTQPDVVNERVFSYGCRFTYNEILAIFRKHYPGKIFIDDIEEIPDRGTVARHRSIELLGKMGKSSGFLSLEEIIVKWSRWVVEAEKIGWGDVAKERMEEITGR